MSPWYTELASRMVRENASMMQVQTEMNLGMTQKECNQLFQSPTFTNVYRAEQNRYYKEIASDPARNKQTTIGNLTLIAQKLEKEESFEQAAKVHMFIAKLEGWTDATTTVNVFGDLSAKDLQTMRDKVKAAAVN